MTDEQEAATRIALARFRDAWFADMIGVMVGLACETHPEEMRKALASVFDLAGVQEQTTRMMNVLAATQATANEVRELGLAIEADLDRIERRMDADGADLERIKRRIDRMTLRIDQAARKYAALVKQMEPTETVT